MNTHGDIIKKVSPYSVSLNLKGIPCLVVGGGTIAFRKIESLMASGAEVKVVSPEIVPEIEALEGITIINRKFQIEDLDGRFLVISATNDRSVNETVANAARKRCMLVNVVDVPDLCNFFVNAQVKRGDLAISISTGGASPALAKKIRRELEQQYGEEYAGFLELMREYRSNAIDTVTDPDRRKYIFELLASAGIEKILKEQGEHAARKAIEDTIEKGAGASESAEQEQ